VDLSESHLSSLFRKYIGDAPIKYQQKQRMRLACRYLLDPYLTVGQAAKQCGYEDINFFIRIFRKNYNLSPGKWRKQFSSAETTD
jgi:AraC-like DNA-binding protein